MELTQQLINLNGHIGQKLFRSDKLPRDVLFSMVSPDIYMSRQYFSKPKTTKKSSSIKKAKKNLMKLIDDTSEGIEKLVSSVETFANASKENFISDNKYISDKKQNSLKRGFSKLYTAFMNYGKKAYETVKKKKNQVIKNVKLTMLKIIKIAEQVHAELTPMWNMPMFTFKDLDTLAPAVSPHISISAGDSKYENGYSYIKYRID